MADNLPADEGSQKYGLWDTKEKSWVRGKEYDSLSSANKGADRLDNKYGSYRYTAKAIGGGGGMGGGLKMGLSPSLENPIQNAKGGKVSASKRADGIAHRGKTRGKLV